MNKQDLVTVIVGKTEMTRKDVEFIVDSVFDTMIAKLKAGEQVKISGFGTFEKRKRPARKGTNPSSHKVITIPESKTIALKVSKSLKEKL